MLDNVLSFNCKPKTIVRRVRNVSYEVSYDPVERMWHTHVTVVIQPQEFESKHTTQAAALAAAESYVKICAG